jgi:pyridoxine/pyridoxamine 5'-phosphate oxidase
VFIVLVCWRGKAICAVPAEHFDAMITARISKNGSQEKQYQILVQLLDRKWFSVYVNTPHTRGKTLAAKKIPRSDFPKVLFK